MNMIIDVDQTYGVGKVRRPGLPTGGATGPVNHRSAPRVRGADGESAGTVKAQSLNNRRVVSSALGPMLPVALPGALPCRAVLQMDLPVGTGQDLQLHRRSCEPR